MAVRKTKKGLALKPSDQQKEFLLKHQLRGLNLLLQKRQEQLKRNALKEGCLDTK